MSIVQGGPRRPPAVPEVVPLADRLAGVRDQPVSFLLLVTAVWLAVAPWALHYPADGTRGAHLVETCTAVFLAIVALARLFRPRGGGSDLLVLVAGVGLAVAPFAAGYGTTPVTHGTRLNDLVTGVVVILLAAAGHGMRVAARRLRERGGG